MKTIKVTFNIWGNYCMFIGTEKVLDTGEEWTAKEWLAEMIATKQYKLSAKSVFTEQQIIDHVKRYTK